MKSDHVFQGFHCLPRASERLSERGEDREREAAVEGARGLVQTPALSDQNSKVMCTTGRHVLPIGRVVNQILQTQCGPLV